VKGGASVTTKAEAAIAKNWPFPADSMASLGAGPLNGEASIPFPIVAEPSEAYRSWQLEGTSYRDRRLAGLLFGVSPQSSRGPHQ
jgi:hypothetical protein